ncbi:hypothetical protein [Almyronema epifaneia]|uniref:Uncharacterized protein n=1 Tax=Almyronema epifaneia S1 TaxID=2991925 RepID=A0ABW6IE30_9CYAN
MNWEILKRRYFEADQSFQLDNLMLNLVRLQLLADDGAQGAVAQYFVTESQFFIEWTVPNFDLEADIAFAAELVDLQRLLSQWKLGWSELWSDERQRFEIAAQARHWCSVISSRKESLSD